MSFSDHPKSSKPLAVCILIYVFKESKFYIIYPKTDVRLRLGNFFVTFCKKVMLDAVTGDINARLCVCIIMAISIVLTAA